MLLAELDTGHLNQREHRGKCKVSEEECDQVHRGVSCGMQRGPGQKLFRAEARVLHTKPLGQGFSTYVSRPPTGVTYQISTLQSITVMLETWLAGW